MVASKQSRPSVVTEYIGRGIKFFAGSLPFAKAVRGNVSDDPRVEEDFYADRESYLGTVADRSALLPWPVANQYRIVTARRHDRVAEESRRDQYTYAHAKSPLMIAIRLIHGTSDRATSPHATLKLYERLPNEDKEIELYEGYEHGE